MTANPRHSACLASCPLRGGYGGGLGGCGGGGGRAAEG
eukprot:CAMPEP_0115883384 /NCGR_PEP_ID=MMETSP0287-20121206/29537_1 /TAXON_ID=412157 /ORGANISM="Chrysochromulina rotalis, Strain UIO044" /LENGTH=37 /DNA_ID= /DNA_START= /DNA_END= /DNA_ORIENTATION=